MDKYAVLGGGNAGFAFAGHLGVRGFPVSLYEDPRYFDSPSIQKVKEQGGIHMLEYIEGFGKLELVTSDMAQAIKGVQVVIIAVPEFAQDSFFNEYVKHAEDGQIVVFFPGNYAAFKYKKAIADSGKSLTIAEASSIPYGARKKGEPGTVNIIGLKHKLHVACVPYANMDLVLGKLNEFNDIFLPGDNVLAVALNNPNFVVHCTGTALNAGWVESTKGNFSLYWEGMSPSVCNVIEAVDAERCAVAEAFGFKILSEKEFFAFYYEITADTLYEVIQKSENHGGSGAPPSLKDRYIEEDAPAGLTAVVALGKQYGIPTPTCQAILTICSALNKTDYYDKGLNTKRLGIDSMSKDEVIAYVK